MSLAGDDIEIYEPLRVRAEPPFGSESRGSLFLHMEHHFNIDIAQKYGIEGAILIHNLYFWIRKNASNKSHCYDGRYWTYNSNRAFAELFPYMTANKIYRVISALEEAGVIMKGNYNQTKMDRTCWYAFTDEAIEMLESFGYSNIDFAKMQNAVCENVKAIPDNNTDNNPNTKKEKIDNNSYYLKKKERSSDDLSYIDDDMKDIWVEWLGYLDALGKPYRIMQTAKQNYHILVDLAQHNVNVAERIVRRSIAKGYWSLFPLREIDTDTLIPAQDDEVIINGQVYR